MKQAAADQIVPKDFPELAALVWNGDPARPISANKAFELYERNWRHVDQNKLDGHEKALLQRLIKTCGNGVFLAA